MLLLSLKLINLFLLHILLLMKFSLQSNNQRRGKPPGLDGLHADFYKDNWAIVANTAICLVNNTISGQLSQDQINNTNLILIPKIKNKILALDYRPISLCNVTYKTITKNFGNRLSFALLNIISNNQAGLLMADISWITQLLELISCITFIELIIFTWLLNQI